MRRKKSKRISLLIAFVMAASVFAGVPLTSAYAASSPEKAASPFEKTAPPPMTLESLKKAAEQDTDGHPVGGALPYTGPTTSDTGKSLGSQGPATTAALPASVDLSTSTYFPPIGDQGKTGGCVAWSTTYYQFTYQASRLHKVSAQSKANQYSPTFIYPFFNNGQDSGGVAPWAYMALEAQGSARMSEYPANTSGAKASYLAFDLNTAHWRHALKTRVSTWKALTFSNVKTTPTPVTGPTDSRLNAMKSYLANGQPISFATDTTGWITSDDLNSISYGYIQPFNNQFVFLANWAGLGRRGGHEMTLVGYDDNYTYTYYNAYYGQSVTLKGAFKVANQWGAGWGNSGYAYLMYDALNSTSTCPDPFITGGIYASYGIHHQPFIEGYQYFVIGVKDYPCTATAEVTMSSGARGTTLVQTGTSPLSKKTPAKSSIVFPGLPKSSMAYTGFLYSGGNYPLKWNGGKGQKFTFVFDCNVPKGQDTLKKSYYLYVADDAAFSAYYGYTKGLKKDSKVTKVVSVKIKNQSRKVILKASPNLSLNGKSVLLKLTRVTKLKAPKKTFAVKRGKSVRIPYTAYYGKQKIKAGLIWKSSNSKVAAVSQTGVVKASKKGKATITGVSGNGKKIRVTVRVY